MPSLTTDRPLQDAIAMLRGKTVVGSAMGSREWERLQAEIRMRAMFAARVEKERILAEMQERLRVRLELGRKDGRTMDRGVFIEEMREVLRQEGYKRGEAKRGSLQDLKSTRRLGLIWDMNLAQAQGYARWKGEMTETARLMVPCMELVRVRERMERREWPDVWSRAGGEFFDEPGSNDDYPSAPGRMIAAKDDPIWTRISRFGTPWPPFDWGSGMGLKPIRRKEAEALGVLGPDDLVQAQDTPFNEGHRMSAREIPASGRESLRSALGDAIRFDGDEVSLHRVATPETYEQQRQDPIESLRERARRISDAGRDTFSGARSGDDAAAWPPGAESEILASTSAVAVGRKQLYHEQWPGGPDAAERFARLIRGYLPDEVAVMVRGDHVHAWRPDLLDLAPDAIQALSEAGENGILLGYGQNLGDRPAMTVTLRDDTGRVLGGFFAPPNGWREYARARARDFMDALGKSIRVFADGKEVGL